MKKIRELIDKRNRLIQQSRALLDKATGEKRGLTAEEQTQFDTISTEIDALRLEIDNETRQIELERQRAEDELRLRREGGPGADRDGDGNRTLPERQMLGFRSYLRNGLAGMSGDGAAEFRALQADADTQGGFVMSPVEWVSSLVKAVDDLVFVRGRATKYSTMGAQSLGVPTLEADPADADWTSEILTGAEDSTMAFGKRELHPQPLAKRIKVSQKLLRGATINAEDLVRQRLAYKFAVTQEKAFLTGHGANQPLGLFTASTNGIPTGRDVQTGSATDITFDGLYDAKYSLKGAYLSKAEWLFHRDGMKRIAKLKDSQNRYLWEPSQKVGQPDTLLGHPLMMSEHVPNTFTSGLYVGMFADFSWYWIADNLAMEVQRLTELYAENNQVGFIGRLETDGMPVLAEAFVRLKTN